MSETKLQAKSPEHARALIREQMERMKQQDAERLIVPEGTGDAITLSFAEAAEREGLTAEDYEANYLADNKRLVELREEYERQWAPQDEREMEELRAENLLLRDEQGRGAMRALPDRPLPVRVLNPREILRDEATRLAEQLVEGYDTGQNRSHRFGDDVTRMLWERAVGPGGGVGATADQIAGAIAIDDYTPLPGSDRVHLNACRSRPASGYQYRTLIQRKRVQEAAFTAVDTASAEGGFAYEDITRRLRRNTAHVPVDNETMRDVPMVADLIENDLMRDAYEKASVGVLRGDGTGENLQGLDGLSATSYFTNAGGLAPNEIDWDVATATIVSGVFTPTPADLQEMFGHLNTGISDAAENGKTEPNLITTTYGVWNLLAGARSSSDNHFIFRNPLNPMQMAYYGITVMRSDEFAVPANNSLIASIGAWNRWADCRAWGMEIKYGLSGTDLIQNRQTIALDYHLDIVFKRANAFSRIRLNVS